MKKHIILFLHKQRWLCAFVLFPFWIQWRKKNILWMILALGMIGGQRRGFAQTYIPFPTDSAQWSVRHTINSPFSQNTIQYKMKGDTMLNGITYHKIYYSLDLNYSSPNQTLRCFLREDTTKKIFVKYPPGMGTDTSEFMLYNFNVAIGDTVTIKLLYFNTDSVYKLLVSNIFSYSTNVDTRKYYQLQAMGSTIWQCSIGFGWIGGVGSTLSPFYNEIPEWACYDEGYQVSCFWHKGIYILGGGSAMFQQV